MNKFISLISLLVISLCLPGYVAKANIDGPALHSGPSYDVRVINEDGGYYGEYDCLNYSETYSKYSYGDKITIEMEMEIDDEYYGCSEGASYECIKLDDTELVSENLNRGYSENLDSIITLNTNDIQVFDKPCLKCNVIGTISNNKMVKNTRIFHYSGVPCGSSFSTTWLYIITDNISGWILQSEDNITYENTKTDNDNTKTNEVDEREDYTSMKSNELDTKTVNRDKILFVIAIVSFFIGVGAFAILIYINKNKFKLNEKDSVKNEK